MYANHCNVVVNPADINDVGSYGYAEEKVSNSAYKKSRDGEGGSCEQSLKSQK